MTMQHGSNFPRGWRKPLAGLVLIWAAVFGGLIAVPAPRARADVEWDKKMAYLIGVTARPGYHFANSDEALNYGYGVCDKISQGRAYPLLITDIQHDFDTVDDYQASYLIIQAANELCPEQIWQLRKSAAHYRPAPGTLP